MNRALFYLWFTQIKRRLLRFATGLRRPSMFLGFAAVVSSNAFLFHYRHEEMFAQVVRPASLVGGALIMLYGSVFTGFRQRGLVFEPPDLEFIFTAPFTRRQIIVYRLLPNYLYAVVQSLVFLLLFATHLKHPLFAAVCLTLFQVACFHIAAAAAIFSGTLPEQLYERLRWMMFCVFAFSAVFYFRVAWGFKMIPGILSLPLAQLLFYPAVNVPDLDVAAFASAWLARFLPSRDFPIRQLWEPALFLAAFAALAAGTLWCLLKIKVDIFEASLVSTERTATKGRQLKEGHLSEIIAASPSQSVPLPSLRLFQGVGAIVWKNLVVALRSRRSLVFAAAFTLLYTGFLVGLRMTLRHLLAGDVDLPASEIQAFDASLVSLLFFLPFFLQRAFPFDFRRDGNHLVGFRTLPVGPLALTLAELAVPTGLCIAFQALGFVILLSFARFPWYLVFLIVVIYPAVVLALNSVWNLHYLLAATKRAGGKAESASPAATLMVVAFSFCVFLPAIWTGQFVGKLLPWPAGLPIGFGSAVAVQCVIDLLLVLLLARIYQNFEVSRDFQ